MIDNPKDLTFFESLASQMQKPESNLKIPSSAIIDKDDKNPADGASNIPLGLKSSKKALQLKQYEKIRQYYD